MPDPLKTNGNPLLNWEIVVSRILCIVPTMQTQVLMASEIGLRIDVMEDVMNTIGQSYGMDALLLTENDLGSSFFDLQSGLAGELFQKCTNYQLRLALVVMDLSIYSPRVAELAFEHRQHRLIRFFDSVELAKSWLES